ncbi:NADPH-dependent F420 reductase [Paenarthrobacter nicotinovorans]|uniref:NADPH-dependent F420 reductase n=1 Tax=Micrococcaceae TaxID=1268 RepID=UPI000876F9F1|nr:MULTISPECIES: NADPH-dependent F420 reductase [Micrococcaceae]MDR6438729.1 NADPH-dependent F420 reductase [Paenarthrobacter nicotinovorans]SCZ56456.1 reduced coenzyme F420:NADP oxidoreductase [Arthrobacter sp. UNCCL28]
MQLENAPLLRIGILGGTGALGGGLAFRWAAAGLPVTIGSRNEQRAAEAVSRITTVLDRPHSLESAGLGECASTADVIVIAVPWDAHEETLTQIRDQARGKIVIDVVNPLAFDKAGAYAPAVPEGSAAQQAQALLPDSHVVAAFHHVSAVLLADHTVETVDTDVMVLGNDLESTKAVQELVDLIPGMRGIFAGKLRTAAAVEGLTANLIAVNRRYKTHAGIGLTNVGVAAHATA